MILGVPKTRIFLVFDGYSRVEKLLGIKVYTGLQDGRVRPLVHILLRKWLQNWRPGVFFGFRTDVSVGSNLVGNI